jgi:hypothetical protein
LQILWWVQRERQAEPAAENHKCADKRPYKEETNDIGKGLRVRSKPDYARMCEVVLLTVANSRRWIVGAATVAATARSTTCTAATTAAGPSAAATTASSTTAASLAAAASAAATCLPAALTAATTLTATAATRAAGDGARQHSIRGRAKAVIGRSAKSVENGDNNQSNADDQKRIFSRILTGFLSPKPLEGGQHRNTFDEGTLYIRQEKTTGNKIPHLYQGFK